MSSYRADPVSRRDIQKLVKVIRETIGLKDTLYFPIVRFVEHILPILIPEFQFEIASVSEMGNKHGETYPSKKLIRIREDVYLRAVNGEGRDRLTIAHEVGHLLMHKDACIALCRLDSSKPLKAYEDPEWQANAFGGELLASSYLIKGMSIGEVSSKCGVSVTAAKIQLKSVR